MLVKLCKRNNANFFFTSSKNPWFLNFKNSILQVTPHRHHHRHPQRQQNQQQDQQQPGRKRNAQERDVDDDDESGPEVDEGTVSELLDKYADDAGDSSFHVSVAAFCANRSILKQSARISGFFGANLKF